MKRVNSTATPWFASLALVLSLLVACGPSDPIERLQQTRAEYEAEASSFFVREEPIPGAAVVTADPEGDEPSADDEEGDEPSETEPMVPTQSVLSLDILVSTSAPEPIPGLTVELEQIAADKTTVKSSRQLWLDTTGVQKGVSATKTVRIEGIDYEEGDGFFVSVRSPIPADQLSAYAEFEGVNGP